jgi:hypothetical protein
VVDFGHTSLRVTPVVAGVPDWRAARTEEDLGGRALLRNMKRYISEYGAQNLCGINFYTLEFPRKLIF